MKCNQDMILPNVDSCRRRSTDTIETMPSFDHTPSYLQNCNQIFIKGPALTREILEKMNEDLVPKQTVIFGYELNTKKLLYATGLCLFTLISFYGFLLMWFTDLFDNYALSQLVISNKSDGFAMWKKPTPKPLYQVYLFNYTNVEDFMIGLDKKLNVEELGPYVYEESTEKVDIEFYEDKVSYRLKKDYEFRPELSKGRQSDQVTVPNLAVLTGAAMVQKQNYFARLGFAGLLAGMDVKAFMTASAHSFIMGYDDKLFDMSKGFSRMNNIDTPDKMGLLATNVGVNKDEFVVNTGKNDINKVGTIEEVNGETELDYFSTNECNRLSATEGVNYPPNLIQSKRPVRYLFLPACRAMPMEFDQEVSILDGKVAAYRYRQPDTVFQTADENLENQCYCSDDGMCPPKGLINATACNMGAPLFISKPHFKGGDPALAESVRGLQPNRADLPETVVHVQPLFGFIMVGQTVIQVNVMVKKSYGVSQLSRFEDDQVLPIAWFNVNLQEDRLPVDFLDIIYQTTFTFKGVKLAFQYGSLLTTVMAFIFTTVIIIKWLRMRQTRIQQRQYAIRRRNEPHVEFAVV